MSGKGDVQADEELKDKRNSKVMSLSASGGAVYVGQQNEHYSGQIPLWCKLIGELFRKKMKTLSISVKTSAALNATVSCCSCHDPFNKRWNGICEYDQRMRHRDIC